MSELTVKCPKCFTEVKITEALAAPLVLKAQKEHEAMIVSRNIEFAKREKELRNQQKNIMDTKKAIDDQVVEELAKERVLIADRESKKAKSASAFDLASKSKEVTELQAIIREKDGKLFDAQKIHASVLKQKRELNDARTDLEVTIEKRTQDSISEIQIKEKKKAEDKSSLKLRERDEQISSMKRKIEDLNRKASQGSQQLQGEVMELALEDMLNSKFPHDNIEPVPKGKSGGDIIHRVLLPSGFVCGTILWESKRTKNWSDGWVVKLRDDKRIAKADISVLVSQTLPKDIESFKQYDGVWVCAPQFALPLANALRYTLEEVSVSKRFQEGWENKSEMIYKYFISLDFRLRIETMMEHFSNMREDLDKERNVMMKSWAKRQQQIDKIMGSTAGMYGDLQGIAGQEILNIKSLEFAPKLYTK